MVKIKLLAEKIIGKISAGEVIERPASVLKELIENSIDAKATSIAVYIKSHGIAEIKVVDDGEGIPKQDVILAFQRHATSKISSEEDLYNIKTLGFRGEALYSIAQVSKVRILTQYKQETVGTELYLVAGKVIEEKPAVTQGTTVEVSDLFFNTPVRRKFLRSPSTERAHIIETFQNYCLAFPEIAFYLRIDDEEVLNASRASSIDERIIQVFGAEFYKNLNFKKASSADFEIKLFWGNEELLRKNKIRQNIFINRRPVKDAYLSSVLYKASGIKEGNHPQFLMFIDIEPENVDFNVHPSKREVKFKEPGRIAQHIFKIFEPEKRQLSVMEAPAEWKTDSLFKFEAFKFFPIGSGIVAIPQSDGITFFDYHAAHERINFEKLLKKMKTESIRLVFPYIIDLNTQHYFLIRENLATLRDLGIEAEDFGKNSIIIRSIPDILKNADMVAILEEIADTLKEDIAETSIQEIRNKVAATIACHSSLKASDSITEPEIKLLIEELENVAEPDYCPHGRPIKKFISLEEIKKWLGR